MKYISPSNYYDIEVPHNWTIEGNNNTTSIYNERDGFGAINLTSYEIPHSYIFNVKNELIEFMRDDLDEYSKKINVINKEGQDIAFVEINKGEIFWRYYVIYQRHKALFITYNCDKIYKENERQLVDTIILSIIIN